MRTPVRATAIWFSLVLILALSACGDDDEPSPTTTDAAGTATRTPARTSSVASPTEEPFSGGRDPVEEGAGENLPLGGALLQDVRAAEQAGFDRITFEFEGGVPGYRVEYVEAPIIADPSGMEVQVDGSAFIQIRMEPAAAHDPNTGDETYTGPSELKPGLASLVEAEQTGDFEAVLNWVLGLNEEADFRVTTLEGPPRIVIDVAHP